jgi:hypothetical protein
MVVQDPLDLDLLLRRDCVYAMKDIVSTLFCVIHFPHDGRVVTIYQLSFVGIEFITNSTTSMNDYYMQKVSSLPKLNYVVLSPMPSATDEDEPLTISLVSYELDLVVDTMISSIGILEPDILTHVMTLDMCSSQSVFLPSSEYLLESMTEFFPLTWFPSRSLSS